MRRQSSITRATLAVALAATALAAPAARPHDEPPPDAPDSGVPAVVLLAGAAPTTVTVDPRAPTVDWSADKSATAALLALCGDGTTPAGWHRLRPGAQLDTGPAPCPPAWPAWTPAATFAVVKQPTLGGDGLAGTEPAGPITPVLRLLGALLPRSDLPTGRTTHLDPRPA